MFDVIDHVLKNISILNDSPKRHDTKQISQIHFKMHISSIWNAVILRSPPPAVKKWSEV